MLIFFNFSPVLSVGAAGSRWIYSYQRGSAQK